MTVVRKYLSPTSLTVFSGVMVFLLSCVVAMEPLHESEKMTEAAKGLAGVFTGTGFLGMRKAIADLLAASKADGGHQ